MEKLCEEEPMMDWINRKGSWKHISFLVLILTSNRVFGCSDTGDNDPFLSDEARLIRDLLKRYPHSKTLARPVLNSSHTITVHFGVSLIQILDFDMKNQVLTTLLWKEYKWIDEVLRWNSSEYGGVDWVSLPGNSIWVPDIILYNNIDTRGQQVEDHKEKLVVYNNGSLYWIPPVIYRSSCPVEIANFPFDVQSCNLKFGSWSYATNKINLEFMDGVKKVGVIGYVPNSEWVITGNSATRNIVKYPCCAEEYADLTFTIRMKRNSGFYLRVLLLPTLLLSVMVLIMFWIPPQRPDRTSLGMSLFASFMLLLLLVVQSSPPTTAAKIGTYCCLHIILISTGTMLSVLVVNLSSTKTPMHWLIRKIFIVYLGQCCCMCHPVVPRPRTNRRHKRNQETALLDLSKNGDTEKAALSDSREPSESPSNNSEKHMEETSRHSREWMLLADILDRFFFLAYLILLVAFLIYTFPLPSGDIEVSIFEDQDYT